MLDANSSTGLVESDVIRNVNVLILHPIKHIHDIINCCVLLHNTEFVVKTVNKMRIIILFGAVLLVSS